MAFSNHKSAIPPPSPSPYSRLPTPSNSHFGRPHSSRSASTAVYGSSHPSPSRPSLSQQPSSYDSFAPQPCPSPSPSKIPGFGLQRSNSTVNSVHRRQSSAVDKGRQFEGDSEAITRSPSTVGTGGLRGPGNIRRGTLGSVDVAPNRTLSRPTPYIDSDSREQFEDVKYRGPGLRRPSQSSNAHSSGSGRQQYEEFGNQSSTSPVRKSLGLLSESSPVPMQLKGNHRRDDSQLMPPPPPPLIRQFSGSQAPVSLDLHTASTPSSPPPQIPTPSPRKGTHIRAQSHGIAPSSKPSRAATSTRAADPRPTSTTGKKVSGPARPPSTVNAVSSARPRAVSHNAAEARRMTTPANDIPLPKGSLPATGRTAVPPRPISTRPAEPIASTASTRRPSVVTSRPRPTSSYMAPPGSSASSRGSDTESSMRSDSVASSASNASSVRSDATTRPKHGSLSVSAKTTREPPSPRKSSPVRGHKKNMSMAAPAKQSRQNFNTYAVEYQHAPPMPKPSTSSLMNSSNSQAASATQSTDTLHAQTRLLQLAILHSQSFGATASLQKSAQTELYKRFSEIRDKNAIVDQAYRREQELVDLHAMSLVLRKPSGSGLSSSANWKNKLSGSPEEAIQLLSEQLSKVLAWFAEDEYEGEYTRMIRAFEEWISLPDGHEKKVDGMGTEFGRDILKMRRKMEMAVGGLEGWMTLVVEGERNDSQDETRAPGLKSSLGRVLAVAVERLKAGLEELNAIQAIERTVAATTRKELRKKLGEVMESRRGGDTTQQKEVAAWEPVWAMPSS